MKNQKSKIIINGLVMILFAAIAAAFICPELTAATAGNLNFVAPSFAIGAIVTRPTQLQKVLQVAQRMGANADSSQFTERAIYDSLPQDGRTQWRFFEGCNARTFPFTNLSENKLQKQENLVIKYISFEALTVTANAAPVTAIGAVPASFYRSDMTVQIGQNVVLKSFPLDDMKPEFSPFARHTAHNVIRLGVDLVIPEALEFVVAVQSSTLAASTTTNIMCKLHGQATIFSPRANF